MELVVISRKVMWGSELTHKAVVAEVEVETGHFRVASKYAIYGDEAIKAYRANDIKAFGPLIDRSFGFWHIAGDNLW